jgi:hypothetical protein
MRQGGRAADLHDDLAGTKGSREGYRCAAVPPLPGIVANAALRPFFEAIEKDVVPRRQADAFYLQAETTIASLVKTAIVLYKLRGA